MTRVCLQLDSCALLACAMWMYTLMPAMPVGPPVLSRTDNHAMKPHLLSWTIGGFAASRTLSQFSDCSAALRHRALNQSVVLEA